MSLLSAFSNQIHPLSPNKNALKIINTVYLLYSTGWALGKGNLERGAIPDLEPRDREGRT